MGIHHSPHTHTISIPMGIPMGIPIPTAALPFSIHHFLSFLFPTLHFAYLARSSPSPIHVAAVERPQLDPGSIVLLQLLIKPYPGSWG